MSSPPTKLSLNGRDIETSWLLMQDLDTTKANAPGAQRRLAYVPQSDPAPDGVAQWLEFFEGRYSLLTPCDPPKDDESLHTFYRTTVDVPLSTSQPDTADLKGDTYRLCLSPLEPAEDAPYYGQYHLLQLGDQWHEVQALFAATTAKSTLNLVQLDTSREDLRLLLLEHKEPLPEDTPTTSRIFQSLKAVFSGAQVYLFIFFFLLALLELGLQVFDLSESPNAFSFLFRAFFFLVLGAAIATAATAATANAFFSLRRALFWNPRISQDIELFAQSIEALQKAAPPTPHALAQSPHTNTLMKLLIRLIWASPARLPDNARRRAALFQRLLYRMAMMGLWLQFDRARLLEALALVNKDNDPQFVREQLSAYAQRFEDQIAPRSMQALQSLFQDLHTQLATPSPESLANLTPPAWLLIWDQDIQNNFPELIHYQILGIIEEYQQLNSEP